MKSYKKAVCVHGHFYQPSRINPFTNEMPNEEGSQPYSNWTENIFFSCYKPNIDLGNFKFFNFNIGPTLTAWMKRFHPDYLEKLIVQEKESVLKFGASNAIAQPYHHSILPLCNTQDKLTQIKWGIEDYKLHFKHAPEGMWLPETAVDIETLEIMADEGIIYTILAPWQAKDNSLDTTQPYFVKLKNNKKMIVFFFDQFISSQVSFNPEATEDGDRFINETLLPRFNTQGPPAEHDQLILIASDGELYGHHQKFRDKFISYVFKKLIQDDSIDYVTLGSWIKNYEPENEVEIISDTSWSCHHGIERWKDVCGCTPNATWKAPFRKGLDLLASEIDNIYEREISILIKDSWELRNRYIQVINETSSIEELIQSESLNGIAMDDMKIEKISMLLEAQKSRQRMFTSCGWFFDDLNRVEPEYNILHAVHAVLLIKWATSDDLSSFELEKLKDVISNDGSITGDGIFKRFYTMYQ